MRRWEANVLGIYHPPGKLDRLLKHIEENHHLRGDILEAGVYRGKTLLAIGLLLKEMGSDKRVWGYDTFGGFPGIYSHNDSWERFRDLRKEGRISEAHLRDVLRYRRLRSISSEIPLELHPGAIGLSGDFSRASLEVLFRKIDLLGLQYHVQLVQGPFKETMTHMGPLMAANLDCDLYESYKVALPFVWERLEPGGMVHLDEYYSLKFPGARIACDEFFEGHLDYWSDEGWERWYAIKAPS